MTVATYLAWPCAGFLYHCPHRLGSTVAVTALLCCDPAWRKSGRIVHVFEVVKVENAKEMKEACRNMAEINSLWRRFLPDPVKKRGSGATGGSDAYSSLGPGTGMSLLVKGSLQLHMTLPIAEQAHERLDRPPPAYRPSTSRLRSERRPCPAPSRAAVEVLRAATAQHKDGNLSMQTRWARQRAS